MYSKIWVILVWNCLLLYLSRILLVSLFSVEKKGYFSFFVIFFSFLPLFLLSFFLSFPSLPEFQKRLFLSLWRMNVCVHVCTHLHVHAWCAHGDQRMMWCAGLTSYLVWHRSLAAYLSAGPLACKFLGSLLPLPPSHPSNSGIIEMYCCISFTADLDQNSGPKSTSKELYLLKQSPWAQTHQPYFFTRIQDYVCHCSFQNILN